MSQSNGFSYSPHFKTSAVKRGSSSSYQQLSTGYNQLYQHQAYAAMNGASNVSHYPYQHTLVAYPANMVTTDDGANVIGTTMSQDSSSGFAFPVVTDQTLGNPALNGSMQQTVQISHQHPDTIFAGGPQAQMMVTYPSGYIPNNNDFINEATPTQAESLLPGMQTQLGATSPVYSLSGSSQPQQAASRLEVRTHSQAFQRPNLTSNTQSRASSQPIAYALEKSGRNRLGSSPSLTNSLGEKVKRGDKGNSWLIANAQSKPRARSALPGGSGYHGQIPSSDGRQRIMNHVPSQSEVGRVTSPPTPLNLGIQSSVIPQHSVEGLNYVESDGLIVSHKTRTAPQALSTSDHKSPIGLSESLKSQRRNFSGSALPPNPPTKNRHLDYLGRELEVISPPNTHNLQPSMTIGDGLEQDAPSPKLSLLPIDGHSEATPTPSCLDTDRNLVTSWSNSQIQRAVSQVDADTDVTGGFVAESANGVEIGVEIKETIEKMLQYKITHPTVFSKIWVQVKKDQGSQETEAISNGNRKINTPIPSQTHAGSGSQLSIEHLETAGSDAGSETSQRRKRKSSGIVSRISEPRRQLTNVVPSASTLIISRSSRGLTKPTHVEGSIKSPAVDGNLSPHGKYTSHREISAQIATPEVARAARSGPIQAPPESPGTWSKEKKKVLAQALRTKLASISGTASTAITTDEIIRTFNNTPSMAEVRRSLKARGLNIKAEDLYGWWCDTLLKYDARAKNEHQQSKLQGPPLHQGSRSAAPSDLNYDSMGGYAHDPSSTLATPSLSDRHHNLNEIQKPPKSLLSPPMDGNTRKRSYDSIIDLTSEQSPTVIYGSRTSGVEMDTTDDLILRSGELLSSSHADTACYGKPTKLIDQTAKKRMRKSLADEKGKDLSHFEYAKSQQDLLHSNIIITPMDVKKALRRSTYDSDSIAKSVLIAAAKHPTEAPLNHHLDALRNKFVYVNSKSDLSTFRWELVDPGPDEQNIPAARSRIAEVDDTEERNSNIVELRKSFAAVRHRKEVVATNDKALRAANADTANQSARGRPPRHEKVVDHRFSSTDTKGGPSATVASMTYRDRTSTTDKISQVYRQTAQKAPNGSDVTSLAWKPKEAAEASQDPPYSARASEKRPQSLPQGLVRFKPSFVQPRDVVARSGSQVGEASPARIEQRVKSRFPVSSQNSKPSRSMSLTSRKSHTTPKRPSGLRNFLTPPDGIAVVIPSPPPKTGALGRISKR